MSTIKSSESNLILEADGSGNDIKFQANGVEKASIDASGNLTVTGAVTADNLTVNGTGTSNFTSTATSPIQINGTSIPTLTVRNSATPVELQMRATTTEGLVRTATNHPLAFGVNASEKMRIDSSGNVAIGHTSTTGSKFAICDGANSQIQFFPEISTDTNLTQHYDPTASAYINAETRAASHSFKIGTTDAMTIDNNGDVNSVDKLILGKIGSTYTSGEGHSITSWAGDANSQVYLQARNVADSSNIMFVDVNSNTKIKFTAAGNGYWDGVGDSGSADYAEYFEWADGNPSNEDRVGMSVSMVGNKIKIAEDGDVVMGIVSARPGFVGDSASLGWQGKWETDVYGRRVQQDITVYSWEEVVENEDGKLVTKKQEYRHDKIPEGVTVPDDATSVVRQEDKLSAEYDADANYVPRSNRKEWSAIGLMGKLKLRAGQVTDSRWIKMRDISDTIEEWLVR